LVHASLCLATEPTSAVVPTEEIVLFNGRDLAGWTTWLKKSQHDDPAGEISVRDGLLRIGDGDAGYLATNQAYRDYHLSLEYKWGRKNPRDKYVRNSGLLLHGTGPDGSAAGVWMTSIECQLAQGCEGDLVVIRGKDEPGASYPATISSETRVAEDGKTRWKRGGEKVVYSGRQFWWSQHQPHFAERIDTRGKDDVASPLGEWTTVEAICRGDRITIKINGHTVNECFDAKPSAGKILLQGELHEVFFRNVVLRPCAAK
jgi:hypothetical protein